MRVAALDLGSNTFLCLIAEIENGRIREIVSDQVEIVRLGQGLGQGAKAFHPEALVRAEACLKKFSLSIQNHKPDGVLAMATAAARDVRNADQLIKMGASLGIPIEIIPGEKEAEITFQGATSAEKNTSEPVGVLDIGGGSTELIIGKNSKILHGHSFPFGCVKLTEKFLPNVPGSAQQQQALRKLVGQGFDAKLVGWPQEQWPKKVLAVAGTPTELARVQSGGGAFDASKIDGMILTADDLERWFTKLSPLTPSEVKTKYGVNPGRADVLLSGVIILQEAMRALHLSQLSVSTRGVRFGVALELARRKGSQ